LKLTLSIAVALMALYLQAAEPNPEFLAGRDYYAAAEFGKAAGRFQALCNTDHDAQACYWTGLSYERLADVKMPFGCRIDAKAHEYFAKATKLAPTVPLYRDALFDFLLDTTDCSRNALREASGMLSAMPESDPDYDRMRSRLEEESHVNASLETRAARLFLLIPRATYRVAALPADAHAKSRATVRGLQTTGLQSAGRSF